jgi:diaminohydroxyphosphoribosylaminopyrimidine deaminase/5-amino-6-(5-phosphoribosylamino)uracil reductase
MTTHVGQIRMDDVAAMQRAIDLARLGLGMTYPNPIVGAVIVDSNGALISEGFHQGSEHAEVIAISGAESIPPGSSLYISLEPCNHFGKTPPCVDAIISAGISRVIYAIDDPNPVAAGGADRMRAAGIEVISGIGATHARFVNRDWLTKIKKNRPRLIWKMASTMDGKISAADGTSKWITSEPSRADVARMRSQTDAIITSTATVIADDPLLTSKGIGKNPIRIVVGIRDIESDAKVRNSEAETLFIQSHGLEDLLKLLNERGFNQVMIESGPTFGTTLLKEGLVDEIVLFQAPTFLGSGTNSIGNLGIKTMSDRLNFKIAHVETIGTDLKITLLADSFEEMGEK